MIQKWTIPANSTLRYSTGSRMSYTKLTLKMLRVYLRLLCSCCSLSSAQPHFVLDTAIMFIRKDVLTQHQSVLLRKLILPTAEPVCPILGVNIHIKPALSGGSLTWAGQVLPRHQLPAHHRCAWTPKRDEPRRRRASLGRAAWTFGCVLYSHSVLPARHKHLIIPIYNLIYMSKIERTC